MTQQANLFSRIPRTPAIAARRRDRAIDAAQATWVQTAVTWVRAWAWLHRADHSTWLLEDAREAYEEAGLPAPADGRWWGRVVQRLQRDGVIVAAGYGRARSSNLSPKVAWRLA